MIAPQRDFPTAVMAKDLRLRMRGWRWAGVVTLYVAILAAVALAFLLQRYNPGAGESSGAGIRLFQSLAIVQLFLLSFVAPASVAGAISGERQHRTWDLLVASRAPVREIVGGKLLAGIAFNLVLIAASLPIFSLVFLFGGLTLADMVPPFVVFLVTVLLLGAISLLVSSLTTRVTVSYMIGTVAALALTVGISLLALDLQAPGNPGVSTLGSIPFQSGTIPTPLTPLAHLDPLLALLSALPADGGETLLGPLGIVHHAFGLPWTMPLWKAYAMLAFLASILLTLATIRIVRRPGGPSLLRAGDRPPRRRVRAAQSGGGGS